MGSRLSTLSKEEVATAIASNGKKYEAYAKAAVENGVNGDLLADLNGPEELGEILDELEITSKLHRKVLTKALTRAQEEELHKKGQSEDLAGEQLSAGHPASTASTPTQESLTVDIHRYFDAAAAYDLTVHTPHEELNTFDEIAKDILSANSRAQSAFVNLILKDAQHPIGARIRNQDGSTCVNRQIAHVAHEDSVCYNLVRDPSKDILIQELPKGNPFGPTYVGAVIKDQDGNRLGAVCQVAEITDEADKGEQIRLLQRLASMSEDALAERLKLLQRKRLLKKQLAEAAGDEIVLPGQGPIEPVTAAQLQAVDPSDYPSPEEIQASGRRRNSSALPAFRRNLASPQDMEHLPPDMFDAVDASGMPRPPISKHDMERVAAVEALGLHTMDPNGPTAENLRNLIATAAAMFRMPLAQISYHNHAKEFSFCPFSRGLTEQQKAQCDEFVEEILIKDATGAPFLGQRGRGNAVCNYAILSKKIFVVHDLWEDEAFTMYRDLQFIRAYVGCPIISAEGHVIAMLCMFDFTARPDFGKAHELQTKSIARLLSQTIENWALRQEVLRLEEERHLMSKRLDADKRAAPTGEVTLVFTDIEGSTSLWEQNPSVMKDALAIHDAILRKCCSEAWGYEITTEGDAFIVAFHDPVDAISFALKTQKELYWADWPQKLLSLSQASDDPQKSLRGLRVRIGIHHGPASTSQHEVTGRVRYSGVTAKLAKSTEAMTHGGQILVTVDAWRIASSMLESLGSPQVLDLGEHVMMTGSSMSDGIMSKRVLQLVPAEFALDYSSARHGPQTGESHNENAMKGRLFPPLITKRKISPSFDDAPCADSRVTIAFVYSPGLENLSDAASNATLSILGKLLRPLLWEMNGYECKEDRGIWMIAFDSPSEAVLFGLSLMDRVYNTPALDNSVARQELVKVGILAGSFTRMGPHPTTGRADYYGPVVNRAARVAAAAFPGEIYLGVSTAIDPSALELQPPDLGPSVALESRGLRSLKGVSEPIALYSCSKQVVAQ